MRAEVSKSQLTMPFDDLRHLAREGVEAEHAISVRVREDDVPVWRYGGCSTAVFVDFAASVVLWGKDVGAFIPFELHDGVTTFF